MKIKPILILLFVSFIFSKENGYALPTEIHSFIAYLSSIVYDVPTELRVYVGNPNITLNYHDDNICKGAYDEDALRDPRNDPSNLLTWTGLLNWGTHFWQPDEGPYGGLLETVGGFPVNLEQKNAYMRALQLYEYAKSIYKKNPHDAYYILGKISHLLSDMATPAHVHLDPHISDEIYGDDSYEEYLGFKYVYGDEIDGFKAFTNDFSTINLRPVNYDKLPDGGYSQEHLLFRLFNSIAQMSSNYDSDDSDGKLDMGSKRGKSINIYRSDIKGVFATRPFYPKKLLRGDYQVSPERGKFILLNSTLDNLKNSNPPFEKIELIFSDDTKDVHDLTEFEKTDMRNDDIAQIASVLVPSAIEHVAALYQIFWMETHSTLSNDIPTITLNNGSHQLFVKKPDPLAVKINILSKGWANMDVELYAWAEISLPKEKIRYYFDGNWKPFILFSDMKPVILFKLFDINDIIWRVLDETSLLPDISFSINICLDKDIDNIYSPDKSICSGTMVIVE